MTSSKTPSLFHEMTLEKIMGILPGDVQQHRNVTAFPLFYGFKPPVRHLVLKEAMEQTARESVLKQQQQIIVGVMQ